MVSDRYGRHLEFRGFFHHVPHPDTSIEQRILGMQMKVNERVAAHYV
jgi:hypothetical protein